MIKKYSLEYTEQNSVESTRNISPEEWNNFYDRMEIVNQQAQVKSKKSYKSSLDVWVK